MWSKMRFLNKGRIGHSHLWALGFCTLIWFQISAPVVAEDSLFNASGLPIPRFVSFKSEEVNMRIGPGTRYPVEWVYKRKHLPVEVIEEFGHWRRLRDPEGAEGWVHKTLISGSRYAMLTGEMRTLYRQPDENAAALIRAEPGVIGALLACAGEWCKLQIDSRKGWVRRAYLWGVYAGEDIRD